MKCESHKLFRVKENIVNSDKLLFIFTAMGTKIWMYNPFLYKMNKLGYSCIIYDYELDFLFNPTLEGWKEFFDVIITDAKSRLAKYKAKKYHKFYAYGASMGTLIASKFTRDTSDITHLILNLTYGDVAKNIWTFKGVKKAKEGFIKQNIDEQTLRDNIGYMDPINSASELKNKRVFLQLTTKDTVLLYEQSRFTKEVFIKEITHFEYQETSYADHLITGIVNLMKTKTIDKFYQKESSD